MFTLHEPLRMRSNELAARMALLIRAGDAFWWGQATAEPSELTRAMVQHRHALAQGGRFKVFVGIGSSGTLQAEHADIIDFFGYAAAGPHKELAQAGVLDIVPSHYSHLPTLISSGALPVDVVPLQLSLPDGEGRYSLGQVHKNLSASLRRARVVIGEVNTDVSWTHGSSYLRAEDITLLVQSIDPPLDAERMPPGTVEQATARHIAALVQDGATLQVGNGRLPDAVLEALHDRRDPGLHSGAVGDGIAALAEAGVLTNQRKRIDAGVGIAGILMGGARLRRWAHRNPALQLRGTEYTHDPNVLAALNQFVAINSAIKVDLTGQVNAEVAGGVYMGAVGGAVDFLRGAARSKGGLPIVALPATAKGTSRIVSKLSGPVSTSRSDVGLEVTEYGAADLRGRPLSRRVQRMLDIAAPEHRAALERNAHASLRFHWAAFA